MLRASIVMMLLISFGLAGCSGGVEDDERVDESPEETDRQVEEEDDRGGEGGGY